MALVTLLNLIFAQIGSFFSMVLLVIQLGGSGGTYPIQLSNHFFEAIHPWLPMTYAVEGMRKTLMMYNNSAWLQAGVLIGVIAVLITVMWLFYSRRYVQLSQIDFENPKAVAATQNRLTQRMAKVAG
ncbi:YhgE/Pip family protein [Secundilactobacillus silagei]|nr:YhgE/Pip family protein [Secundilactobacillus silagei]